MPQEGSDPTLREKKKSIDTMKVAQSSFCLW